MRYTDKDLYEGMKFRANAWDYDFIIYDIDLKKGRCSLTSNATEGLHHNWHNKDCFIKSVLDNFNSGRCQEQNRQLNYEIY